MAGLKQCLAGTKNRLMSLTHNFKDTLCARVQRDQKFRQALLREAVESILHGEFYIGNAVLRDYVNATVRFQDLEKSTHIPANSLMRMLSLKGSPSVANFAIILASIQKTEGVHFAISLRR